MDASVGEKGSNASIIPSHNQTQPRVRDDHSRRRQAVHFARRFIFLGAAIWLLSSVYGVSVKTFYEDHRTQLDNVKTAKGHGSDSDFNWDKVHKKRELEFKQCYGNFQCARLELPMDYWNGTTDKTIGLAVLKVPATVKVDDPRYRGPVLENPGGPGGSGISYVLNNGVNDAAVIQGDFPKLDGERFYDMIGFDPRGVDLTQPALSCSGDVASAQAWRMRVLEEGTLNSSDASQGRLWAMYNASISQCSHPGVDGIQKYMTTAYVNRDMLELVEALARWQQKELVKAGSDQVVDSKKAMLQYWGFSYGSYLGYSFAAMFPERVGRLIVDGVVDAEDYNAGTWLTNLVDTEKAWTTFSYYCAKAGYPKCPLADRKNPTTEQVKKRADGIIQRMWHNPVPLIGSYAEVVTWSDVRNFIFQALYSPIGRFPKVAQILAELEVGNATTLAEEMRPFHRFSCGSEKDAGDRGSLVHHDAFTNEAILVTDGPDRTRDTREDFQKALSHLMGDSPGFGDIWGGANMAGILYKVRPYYRYAGPFSGNTANPVLFIGNTADPVTPLINCQTVSKGYKDAVCLTQNSVGHCSLSAYSKCTVKHIAAYFANATMPKPDTVCQPDTIPWGDNEIETFEDRTGARLFAERQENFMRSGGGFGLNGISSKFSHKQGLAM